MTFFPHLSSGDGPDIEALLRAAPPDEVQAAFEAFDGSDLTTQARAELVHARGALAMRLGRLDDARDFFDAAREAFDALGDVHGVGVASCEHWLAAIRRGPRAVYADAAKALEALADAYADDREVRVVAMHYRGTALRYAGDAEETLRVLLDALAASEGLGAARAQVLNSLGTLYVVLGAYGAATAVLEHAAELNHQLGDRVSEAISYGQLGSAALARGELETARSYLQRQEWLASLVGDTFGRARALTLLGDTAIDLERYDDAVLSAEQACEVARSVAPPLGMWIAYATRTIGRARLEMGDARALEALQAARARFQKIGNQLGEGLVSWDLACLAAAEGAPEDVSCWFEPAWRFASLGLSARVAQVLSNVCAATSEPEIRHAVALALGAAAQSHPHLAASQEVALVYSEPDTLSVLATRRIEGQRNLGRLAALALQGAGLHVAAIASDAIGERQRALPPQRSRAALAGVVPGVAIWLWPAATSAAELARDLSALHVKTGDDTRAVLRFAPKARAVSVPLAGESGAQLDGIAASKLVMTALALPAGRLDRRAAREWDKEAEALARMSGFESTSLEST